MAKDEKDKQKILQEKYVQLQLITMQIKQVEEQFETLDQRTVEMLHLRESLGNFSAIKEGKKSFAPIGQGIFVETSLGSTKEVLINVGAGVMVRKPVSDAENSINTQVQQLQDITIELGENLKTLAVKAHELELEIDSLS
ncbi:MAG TPA: prefoldin subunit alpha [Candidatus Nanoarchaeia archaeon]|nr:prefoldin subunit alpha [Candidatus Nanoarchaeia archaeon]